jgi:hypothetical protein
LTLLQRKRGVLHPLNILDQGASFFAFRPYHYSLAGDGLSYDLFSVGRDGKPGTADDLRPELPDSLKARSGYRPAVP